ncbi:Potassium channel GORK, partial [Durusdinium trenchii]
ADLHRGESDLGDGYVPQVQKGFYSTKLSPTEVYRCRSEAPCPGGAPGTCAGGLVDTPCAQCHEGSTWTGSDCADCAGWRQVLWGMFIVGIFVFLLALYYLTSNKVTAKATVLFATTASVGLLVMSMQNLGLIGMMTIDWPESLKGIFGVCQFLLLDIDSYGFSCIAGSNPTIRYLLSVLIFPVGVLWLTGCFCTSKLLPAKYHWNGSKVCSTIGAFMQMSFSTMSAASLAPMMCYKHPNGLRSVLKYPDVICGSEEHTLMLVIGWCMLCTCVLGFVALCTYAVVRVPHWSVRRRDAFVAAVRFLVFRFRLDAWWFGVPLLVRGPLLSLPVVLATDYPPVQIVSIAMILSSFLVGQMIFWPWKVPMLNLSDCIVSFCVTLLVTTASLHLKIVDGPMIVFAEAVSTSMLSGIFAALGIMVLMTSSALIYRSALGGKQELRIFNLGPVTNSKRLAMKVKAMASKLEVMEMDDLSARLAALAVFDMNKVTTCITLLATEVAPPEEGAVTYKFNPRINSSSFDPSLAKPKRSKRSTMSSNSVAVKDENEANEKQDGNQDVTEATNRSPAATGQLRRSPAALRANRECMDVSELQFSKDDELMRYVHDVDDALMHYEHDADDVLMRCGHDADDALVCETPLRRYWKWYSVILEILPKSEIVIMREAREHKRLGGADSTGVACGQGIVQRLREELPVLYEEESEQAVALQELEQIRIDTSSVEDEWWGPMMGETFEEIDENLEALMKRLRRTKGSLVGGGAVAVLVGHSYIIRTIFDAYLMKGASTQYRSLRSKLVPCCGVVAARIAWDEKGFPSIKEAMPLLQTKLEQPDPNDPEGGHRASSCTCGRNKVDLPCVLS